MVSQNLIEELRTIIKEDYGVELEIKEVREIAETLVNFFDILSEVEYHGRGITVRRFSHRLTLRLFDMQDRFARVLAPPVLGGRGARHAACDHPQPSILSTAHGRIAGEVIH